MLKLNQFINFYESVYYITYLSYLKKTNKIRESRENTCLVMSFTQVFNLITIYTIFSILSKTDYNIDVLTCFVVIVMAILMWSNSRYFLKSNRYQQIKRKFESNVYSYFKKDVVFYYILTFVSFFSFVGLKAIILN